MIELKEREHYTEVWICKDGVKIGRAEIGDNHRLECFEIYEPFQNKGYGTEALKQLIDKYGVNNLEVLASNKRAMHVYEKCGFILDGTSVFDMKREENDNGRS